MSQGAAHIYTPSTAEESGWENHNRDVPGEDPARVRAVCCGSEPIARLVKNRLPGPTTWPGDAVKRARVTNKVGPQVGHELRHSRDPWR
jgi:hypothetical protein